MAVDENAYNVKYTGTINRSMVDYHMAVDPNICTLDDVAVVDACTNIGKSNG